MAKKASSRSSSRGESVVRASRVPSWARTHADSVRELILSEGCFVSHGDFNAANFAQLVAAVGPHLTKISIGMGFDELLGPPFWAALRARVIPARKLRVLEVDNIPKGFSMSDVEPLVQLRGSLEVLSLVGASLEYGHPAAGLNRFPESFLALTKLRTLVMVWLFKFEAIPAGIANLKKLKYLNVDGCGLLSLPKELGALSQLEVLHLKNNWPLSAAPDDVAFPPELKGMTSLRELRPHVCGLRCMPAFVRELSSLEIIRFDMNPYLNFDAPLDYLIECCPRLRFVSMMKGYGFTWTQQSLAYLEAFKAKLIEKNPSAEVRFP